MKRWMFIASIVLSATNVAFAAEPLHVRLEFSPANTLPSLPVAMRISVTNAAGKPVLVLSPVTARVTGGDAPVDGPVSLPMAWAPKVGTGAANTLAAGETLECIAYIDRFFAENALFYANFPLWKPGTYSIRVTVHTSDGQSATSDAAPLVISTPAGDDAVIWKTLTHDGVDAFSSQTLLERFDVIERYPSSGYYRRVAPFVLYGNKNDDEFASLMTRAVKGLPGAYIDSARAEIALRYYQHASAAVAANDQHAAEEYFEKGRVYARQLIDTPASAFGPILGTGLMPLLKTRAQRAYCYGARQIDHSSPQ